MKLALILNANLLFSPYAKIYSCILDELKIDYDFLGWDRTKSDETGGLFFKKEFPYGTGNRIMWAFNHFAYSRFLKKHIKANNYDKLVVFGPQVGLFLYFFLKRRYNKRFCFDYRDSFIDQYFPKLFNRLLGISGLNVISSPGFKTHLPKGFDYVISHNFDVETLKEGLNKINYDRVFVKRTITIVTIGIIRNYEENYQVMKALFNKPNYLIKFIGKPTKEGAQLRQICMTDQQKNVEFSGFYKVEDVPLLIKDADFINIFLPNNYNSNSTFANRFYIALIFKKPMLVNKGSLEGMYVEKYKLGLAIEDCLKLDEQIQEFIADFNQEEFIANCNTLLNLFLLDYEIFKRKYIEFLSQ